MKRASGDWDSPGVMSQVPREDDFEESLRRALQHAADGVEAVSYTHLTLPTICSV